MVIASAAAGMQIGKSSFKTQANHNSEFFHYARSQLQRAEVVEAGLGFGPVSWSTLHM